MVMRRVLRDKGGSASIFARRRERLHHAQQQKQKRGSHADDSITGQAADQEGRAAHQQDGHRKRPFATLLVAHVAPEQCADRANQEGQGEDGEGVHRGDERVIALMASIKEQYCKSESGATI